ncbi:MAG: hypothetical protein JJU07_16175 [Natronohydrobacter sp.]|nr:hypothetical protein [Natronohydrobacter sp.]
MDDITNIIKEAEQKALKLFGELKEPERTTAICSLFDENDSGNAARLVLRHGHRFRYVEANDGGNWRAFDGKRWIGGKRALARIGNLATDTAQHIKKETKFLAPGKDATQEEIAQAERRIAFRYKHALKSGNNAQAKGMIDKSSGAVIADLEEFDDPQKTAYLFNVANGTIDLRTGKMKRHDPEDRITMISNITFDPQAKCPEWDRFLYSVLEEDTEMKAFLARLIGYTLHGHQQEENVVFILGNEKAEKTNGSNGKSKLTEGIRPIFGEYGWTVKPALICKNKNKNDESSDIADLFRKRIAIGSEFKDTDVIEEDIFKRSTGTDKINARKKFGHAFEFYSTATLFYTANKTPRIDSTDNGVLRRPLFIQLGRVFYKEHEHPNGIPEGGHVADLKLGEKLLAEKQGILAWAIRGAVEYNAEGLKTPTKVMEDKQRRMQGFDPLEEWLEVCVEVADGWKTKQIDLFESFQNFCEFNATKGQRMSRQEFGDRLDRKGWEGKKISGMIQRLGVKLTQHGEQYAKKNTPIITGQSDRIQHLHPVK